MPLKNVRYRIIKTPKGNVRLAFRGKSVVEAKNLKTGATHTPAQFQADKKRRRRAKPKKRGGR